MPDKPQPEPIAVIGTACRFPGEANTPSKLWSLLRSPTELLTPIPADQFSSPGYYHPDGTYHGHTHARSGYFLSPHDAHRVFDARLFGINANEANVLDPQVRLALETVYEAISTAGYSIEAFKGSDTSVFAGCMLGEYERLMLRDEDAIGTYHATGTARAIVSNRVSYFFDWRGASLTIDTACSSSLVAVHQAVQHLRAGGSDVAVVVGANLILDPQNWLSFGKLGMLSSNGRSRMWDQDADGYGRGEGIAAVLLKRLGKAEEDGDEIEFVIREIGVNQDGRTQGLTTPSASAQSNLIQTCYKRAGLDLSNLGDRPQYFEAHGTGTPVGDSIEAEAIATAFFPQGSTHAPKKEQQKLYVGSIKSVIGHTEGTAGLAALLKAGLAIQNGTIPPNLHFKQLNPKIAPFYSNLQVPVQALSWPQVSVRRASVNCFGFGGANCHAIVENYTRLSSSSEHTKPAALIFFSPFVFSAKSKTSLINYLTTFHAYLGSNPKIPLLDLSYTLARRSHLPFSIGLSSTSTADLMSALSTKLALISSDTTSIIRSLQSPNPKVRILGIFTGQGAQHARMAAELLHTSPRARGIISYLDARLAQLPEPDRPHWTILSELQAPAETSRVSQAEFSQPLSTAIQLLQVDMLRASGVHFSCIVGHSSGEIAAAHAAGFLSADEATCVAYYRGLAVTAENGSSTQEAMMAVESTREDVQGLCQSRHFRGKVQIAAVNSEASVTVSGDRDAIERMRDVLSDEGKFARILKVDRAYHHEGHMRQYGERYLAALEGLGIQSERKANDDDDNDDDVTWYSSVYEGKRITPEEKEGLGAKYWAENLTRPVLFMQAVRAVAARGTVDLVVEVGPHPALKGPVLHTLQAGGNTSTSSPPYVCLLRRGTGSVTTATEGIGQLWSHLGKDCVDLSAFERFMQGPDMDIRPRLVKGLPTYAWDHDTEYWHESRYSRAQRFRIGPAHPLLGHVTPDSTQDVVRWRNILRLREIPWVNGHRLQGQSVFPAAGYVVLVIEACVQTWVVKGVPVSVVEVTDLELGKTLTFDPDDVDVEAVFTLSGLQKAGNPEKGGTITADFSYNASVDNESTHLALLASGRVKITLGGLMTGNMAVAALLERAISPPCLISIPTAEFYESLEQVGYQYTGAFRALSGLQRRLGFATGFLDKLESLPGLLVHPAVLDMAFQSTFLARSVPYDGAIWALHVPRRIRSVRVDISLTRAAMADGESRSFACDAMQPLDTDHFDGDVDIYAPGTPQAMIQVQGLECVPFGARTADDDKEVFSTTVWDVAAPDASLVGKDFIPSREQQQLAFLLERVSIYYLQRLGRSVPPDHPARSSGPLSCLFQFAEHSVRQARSGSWSFWQSQWNYDTAETISKASAQFANVIDLQLLTRIGEKLADIATGEIQAIELGMADGLLGEYYRSSLGSDIYTSFLGKTVKQIVHRYPHCHFLEIGAGTGGATRAVFAEIEQAYASYTFTDVSSGFFPAAQENFKGKQHRGIIYKTLDIDKVPADQGFRPHSYDVIVASMVLHATSNLKTTLAHIRSLLRPGGYLVMLEGLPNVNVRLGTIFGAFPGWWAGRDDGRVLSPLVGVEQWDGLLRNTGFGGADSATASVDPLVAPLVVMVAQAADERVMLLREPLNATEKHVLEDVVIVSGRTVSQIRLAYQIQGLLRPFSACQIRTVGSWSEVAVDRMMSEKATILSLSDKDQPFFASNSPTEAAWDALRGTLVRASTLLWVSTSRLDAKPHANMMIGLLRPAPRELPTLDVQFLDFIDEERVNAHVIAETLLRLRLTTRWQRDGVLEGGSAQLTSIEPEIIINKTGRAMIPRLVVHQGMNELYNSSRRSRYETVTMESRTDVVVSLISMDGGDAESRWVLRKLDADKQERNGLFQVSHSSLFALKIAEHGHLFLALGQQDNGQAVFLSSNLGSQIAPWENFVIRVPSEIAPGLEADFLNHVTHHLIASTLLRDLTTGDRVLVLGGSNEFASAVQWQAKNAGVIVSCITNIHPSAAERDIRNLLPSEVTVLVDLSPLPFPRQMRSLLPRHCRIETSDTLYQRQASAALASHANEIHTRLQDAVTYALYSLAETVRPRSRLSVLTLAQTVSADHTERASKLDAIVDWVTTSPVSVQIMPVESHIFLSSHKTYWLAGLSHGLGLSLCEWLFRRGARHIAISSRRPSILTTWLAGMANAGASVNAFPCDLTDEPAVRNTHASICSSMPPVGGVALGAMVLDDVSLPEMTLDQLKRVTAPKVQGSVHLHSLFGPGTTVFPLDFFVMFSSASSVVGYAGQGNYAAANLFMSALAEHRRRQGLASSVIHIGPVLGVGYVTEKNRERDLRHHVDAGEGMFLSEQDFHRLFAEAVLAGRPVSDKGSGCSASIEVSTGIPRIGIGQEDKPMWASNPVLGHFLHNNVGDGNGVDDRDGDLEVVIPLKIRLSQVSSWDEVYNAILGGFLSRISALYRLPVEQLAKEDPATLRLSEMGTDSLLATEIRAWFLKSLQVNIPVLKVLSGATVMELVTTATRTLPAAWIPLISVDDYKPSAQSRFRISTPAVAICSPAPKITKTALAQQPREEDGSDSQSVGDGEGLSELGVGKEDTILNRTKFNKSQKDEHKKIVHEKTAPLSFNQSMLWFVLAFLDDKSSLNHTASFQLNGRLRLDAFEHALQTIGKRHSILRTCFFETHGRPTQGILPQSTIHAEYRHIQNESEVAAVRERLETHNFDIAAGENLHVVLLTLTPTRHFLLLSSHSLVVDGTSLQVLLRDLERHYLDLPPGPRPPQYLSYAARQRQAFQTGEYDNDMCFWRSEFPPDDFPDQLPILSLARGTTSRRAMSRYENTRADVRFGVQTKTAIKALCARCGATPFHFYLGVMRVLLARHTAAAMQGRDVAIGIADANRVEQEDREVMGPLFNVLPLRFKAVDKGASFEDTLKDTRQKVLRALSHAKVPFQVLLNELCAPRSVTCTPIFQAFVDYRLGQREKMNWADCQLEMQSFQVSKIAYDIALDIIDDSGGDCLAMLIVRSDLYSKRDVERLARSYELLVQAFAAHPSISIAEPGVFDAQEVHRALGFSRGPSRQTEWPDTIVHQIDKIMNIRQDHPAVRWDSNRVITYSQLRHRAETIAFALLAGGVSPGARVAVLQEPTADWIASILSVLRIGAVYVPLDRGNPWKRLATMIKDCQPSVLLADNDTYRHMDKIQVSALKVIDVSKLVPFTQPKRPDITAKATDTAAILNWLEWTAQVYDFNSDEIVLQQSSVGFDMSLIQVFTSLCLGGTLVIVPRKLRGDSRAITGLIHSARITYTFTCTSELSTWFKYGDRTLLGLSCWRRAITGVEPGVDGLFAEFAAIGRPDLRLFHAYGPTEISWTATTMELPYRTFFDKTAVQGKTVNIPVGQPLPNYAVYVLDAHLKPVPAGVQGEIYIGGPGVAVGYLNNEALNSDRFLPNLFSAPGQSSTLHRTGDLGCWGEDGELFIEGRVTGDTQIKLRGQRIDILEVERSLIEASAGAIGECVVSVRRSSEQTRGFDDKFLVAHVVLNPDYHQHSDINQLVSDGLLSRLGLPRYMCPSVVVSLDRMPLTNTLKLDRRAIGELELPESFSSDDARHVVQLTELEEQLKELWENVILDNRAGPRPTIRPETDFFHIGGTSILLLDLRRRIHTRWEVDLSLIDMFDASSLAGMARTIDSLLKGRQDSSSESSSTNTNIINWDEETDLPPTLARQEHHSFPSSTTKTDKDPKTILLTGSTGYLGSALLTALISNPSIAHVHCIAVRSQSSSRLVSSPCSPKITLHPGDLSHPTLGLSPDSINALFSTIDMIIHNGADVSYLKTYATLRAPNVQSTKILATFAAPRQIPIHYTSSGNTCSFAAAAGIHPLRPVSVARPPPPCTTILGYAASKWASEVFLEKLACAFAPTWQVYIHRPSNISRTRQGHDGRDESESAVYLCMSGGGGGSQQHEVEGALDSVPLDKVIQGVVSAMVDPTERARQEDVNEEEEQANNNIKFLHYLGGVDLAMDDLRNWVGIAGTNSDGEETNMEVLDLAEWTDRAVKMGMNPALAAFLQSFGSNTASGMVFPRLVN
ncbi:hypothetical protein V8F33_008060 [Rhypophila sp. PSN 637]